MHLLKKVFYFDFILSVYWTVINSFNAAVLSRISVPTKDNGYFCSAGNKNQRWPYLNKSNGSVKWNKYLMKRKQRKDKNEHIPGIQNQFSGNFNFKLLTEQILHIYSFWSDAINH